MKNQHFWMEIFQKSRCGDKIHCLIGNCGSKLAYSVGSTKGMWTHLKAKHPQEHSALAPNIDNKQVINYI
jgi:hypothetical protein